MTYLTNIFIHLEMRRQPWKYLNKTICYSNQLNLNLVSNIGIYDQLNLIYKDNWVMVVNFIFLFIDV